MTEAAAEMPATSLNEDVYAHLYHAFQSGDYAEILGSDVIDFLDGLPDKDEAVQDLASEVLAQYHAKLSDG